jgi:hypothetical protein
MEIISKWGANYLVCAPNKYKPNPEKLTFGTTVISPGTKISKIGEKKRTSFEMEDGNYLEYEGTLLVDGSRFCVFNSSAIDDIKKEPIYRYVFAMDERTKAPTFLLLFNKTFQCSRDVDCRIITLWKNK